MNGENNQVPISQTPQAPQTPPTLPPTPKITPLAPPAPSRPKKGLIIKIILIAVGVLVVAGGATTVVLAIRAWDPLWNPFRPSPEKVLAEMAKKMQEVKSVSAALKASFDLKTGDAKENGRMTLILTSDSDQKNKKSKAKLEMSINGFGLANNISAALETRIVEENGYLKLADFALPAAAASDLKDYGIDINAIKGQWIKAPIEEISAEEQNQAKAINNLFSGKNLFVVKKEMPDQALNGREMYRYSVALDKEELKKVIPGLLKISSPSQSSELEQLGIDPEQVLAGFIDKIGEVNADVWIGKEDYLVYKITLEKTLSDVLKILMGDIAPSEGVPKIVLAINAEIGFSNFDKPVQVEVPKKFVPFENLLAEYMQKAQQRANDESIIMNIDALYSAADSLYQTYKSYSKLSCLQINAKPSCEEIKNIIGMNPIVRVSKTKYCIFAKLTVKDNNQDKYYCVDSSGNYGQTTKNPASTGYCTGKTFLCPAQ